MVRSSWERPRASELMQPLTGLAIVVGLTVAVAAVGLLISFAVALVF